MIKDTARHYTPSSDAFQLPKLSQKPYSGIVQFFSQVYMSIYSHTFYSLCPKFTTPQASYISEPLIYRLFSAAHQNKWVSLLEWGAAVTISISVFSLRSSFSKLDYNPRCISLFFFFLCWVLTSPPFLSSETRGVHLRMYLNHTSYKVYFFDFEAFTVYV